MNEQHGTDTENLFLLSVLAIFTLYNFLHIFKILTVLLGGRENENENYI